MIRELFEQHLRFDQLQDASRSVEVPSGRIQYIVKGDRGPFVLYLHGSPGGCDSVRFVHPDYRTLAPSRPGYLGTPLEVGESPRAQATACTELLDALDIEEVVIMAASGGGPCGLELARQYPERVRGLIAIEVVSDSYEAKPLPTLMRSDIGAWLFLKLMGTQRLLKLMIPDAHNRQRILESTRKQEIFSELMWSSWPPSKRLQGFDNDLAHYASWSIEASEITVPALIIHGTDDINVPFSQSQALASAMPDARLHPIEGGDHFMPASHADELRDLIESFLDMLEY